MSSVEWVSRRKQDNETKHTLWVAWLPQWSVQSTKGCHIWPWNQINNRNDVSRTHCVLRVTEMCLLNSWWHMRTKVTTENKDVIFTHDSLLPWRYKGWLESQKDWLLGSCRLPPRSKPCHTVITTYVTSTRTECCDLRIMPEGARKKVQTCRPRLCEGTAPNGKGSTNSARHF